MPKQKKSSQAGCNAGEPLTLTVTIPAGAVPLFKALCAVKRATLPQVRLHDPPGRKEAGLPSDRIPIPPMTDAAIAAHAVVRWLVSEEAMQLMDDCLNRVLADSEP